MVVTLQPVRAQAGTYLQGFVSFGAMALTGQPMSDKDYIIREHAISTDTFFFTFSSFFD